MMVVQDYVGSRQILDDLSPALNLREIYSTLQADWFARLKPLPAFRRFLTGKVFSEGLMAPVSEENLLDYWRKMASVKFDMTTGIATLQVKAFSAGNPFGLRRLFWNLVKTWLTNSPIDLWRMP